ncbi:hypothetical protein AMK23_35065 [Streptomyces sp. CB02130]|nr:hypothetical protein AMK23_35065 [Streptomyces sp. CB02130]
MAFLPQAGPVTLTATAGAAAAARQEVEFALYPLRCSPDAAVRAAHRAGAQDASWIASELVAHVLHHTEYSRECLLVCVLSSGGITVTDSCDEALPHFPGAPLGGRARAGSLFRSVVSAYSLLCRGRYG